MYCTIKCKNICQKDSVTKVRSGYVETLVVANVNQQLLHRKGARYNKKSTLLFKIISNAKQCQCQLQMSQKDAQVQNVSTDTPSRPSFHQQEKKVGCSRVPLSGVPGWGRARGAVQVAEHLPDKHRPWVQIPLLPPNTKVNRSAWARTASLLSQRIPSSRTFSRLRTPLLQLLPQSLCFPAPHFILPTTFGSSYHLLTAAL